MRPWSPCRADTAAALLDGPGTCRQIAQRTGWSVGDTQVALQNLVKAGDACKPRSVRVRGVCRPVPVYERCARPEEQAIERESAMAALMGAMGRMVGCE